MVRLGIGNPHGLSPLILSFTLQYDARGTPHLGWMRSRSSNSHVAAARSLPSASTLQFSSIFRQKVLCLFKPEPDVDS